MSDGLGLTPEEKAWALEVVAKADAIREAMKRVAPDLDQSLFGDVPVDLGDLWEIAENHRRRVEKILALSGPADRARLADLLEDLWYGDLTAHLPSHLRSMRKTLPKLIELLDDQHDKTEQ